MGRCAWILALTAPLLGACLGPPPVGRKVIDAVVIEGAGDVSATTLKSKIATHPTPRLLGFIERVYDYELYDREVLEQDLHRIERYYRAHGHFQAKVTAARVERLKDDRVRVYIRVVEGPPTRVKQRNIELKGGSEHGQELRRIVEGAVVLHVGDVFDEEKMEESRKAVENALADRGYAFAEVESNARVDVIKESVTLNLTVKPGPVASYGEIKVVGLEQIPEQHVRAALYVREGKRYSKADIRKSSQALQRMGVFASAEVRQELKGHEDDAVVPVSVVLKEGAMHTVRLGGGARLDIFKFTTSLRATWEDRNFFGNRRRFTADTRPGLTWFPLRFNRINEFHRALPENRLRLTLEQPNIITAAQTGIASAEYNVYPLVYELPENQDPADERIIGYQELRTRFGLENHFFNEHLYVTLAYNWQANFPFTYQKDKPEGLDTVTVSFPELLTSLDYRDDPLAPTRGFLVTNSLQVAVPVLGQLTDVKVQPEARAYIPLWDWGNSHLVLAMKASVGMLFPMDYGESLEGKTGEAGSPETIRDQQKLLFRVFYAGGPNSNRGYGFRSIGPHGALGFLAPSDRECGFVLENRSDQDACLRPLGGLSLWEASVELRYPIIRGVLRGALFVDAADLRRGKTSFRLLAPHLSPGTGVRVLTPVGPIRVDLAYRLPPTLTGDNTEDLLQGEPEPQGLFGTDVPLAITAAIGEAF